MRPRARPSRPSPPPPRRRRTARAAGRAPARPPSPRQAARPGANRERETAVLEDRLAVALAKIEERKSRAQEVLAGRRAAVEEAARLVGAASGALETARARLEHATHGRRAAEESLTVLKSSREALVASLHAAAVRTAALETTPASRAAFGESARRALAAAGITPSGVLADHFDAASGYETALDAALGAALEAPVLESRAALDAALRAVREGKLGTARFVHPLLDTPFPLKPVDPRVKGIAKELLSPKSAQAPARALPDAVVVANVDDALAIAAVHPERTIVTESGVVVRGAVVEAAGTDVPGEGLFTVRRDLKNLAGESAARSRRSSRRRRLDRGPRGPGRRLRRDAGRGGGAGTRRRARALRSSREGGRRARGGGTREEGDRRPRGRGERTRGRPRPRPGEPRRGRAPRGHSRLRDGDRRENARGARGGARRRQSRAPLRSRGGRFRAQRPRRPDGARPRAHGRRRVRRGPLARSRASRRRARGLPRRVEARRVHALESGASGLAALTAAAGAAAAAERAARTWTARPPRARRPRTPGGAASRRRSTPRAGRRRGPRPRAAPADQDHLVETCRAEFGCLPGELPALERSEEELAVAEDEFEGPGSRRTSCRRRSPSRRLGPVNRGSREYTVRDARFVELSAQKADLEASLAQILETIKTINQTSSARFAEAFAAVNANFGVVFQRLFRGGTASMHLLDEDDPLDSGLEIMAQPPGKRNQTIGLLSGGEKALTAIALLVAIFRFKPSPFCILDEVDAPLDEANIDRFTSLLVELSEETQFVLITHNKRTMETAQALYGVTQEEPGVSKLVSVRFD